MEKDNCGMLFEYLKSILYDTPINRPDLEDLDEPYRRLGEGLSYLQQAVEEMLAYTADLSKGNLSGPIPSRENFLCVNLKNLHASLNHLTWQAKQVASGDYSQHVSYLGEFSEAFNTMTAQLKEREARLEEEAVKARQKAAVIEEYNELLLEMTKRRNEWILVVDTEKRDIVYCNKRKDGKQIDPAECEICQHRLSFRNRFLNWQDDEQYKVWELEEGERFFRITTFNIEWRGHKAHAHIIVDVTEDKQAEEKLTSMAYRDPGTGVQNRLFFEEYMKKIFHEKRDITFCYMDLDGLKYVNDRYGHNEGDRYIRSFVSVIKSYFRCTDVFARIGGDEFCILLPGCQKESAEHKLAQLLTLFVRENREAYPKSFSYGVVEIEGSANGRTLDQTVELADAAMYECKRKNKKEYPRI